MKCETDSVGSYLVDQDPLLPPLHSLLPGLQGRLHPLQSLLPGLQGRLHPLHSLQNRLHPLHSLLPLSRRTLSSTRHVGSGLWHPRWSLWGSHVWVAVQFWASPSWARSAIKVHTGSFTLPASQKNFKGIKTMSLQPPVPRSATPPPTYSALGTTARKRASRPRRGLCGDLPRYSSGQRLGARGTSATREARGLHC